VIGKVSRSSTRTFPEEPPHSTPRRASTCGRCSNQGQAKSFDLFKVRSRGEDGQVWCCEAQSLPDGTRRKLQLHLVALTKRTKAVFICSLLYNYERKYNVMKNTETLVVC